MDNKKMYFLLSCCTKQFWNECCLDVFWLTKNIPNANSFNKYWFRKDVMHTYKVPASVLGFVSTKHMSAFGERKATYLMCIKVACIED